MQKSASGFQGKWIEDRLNELAENTCIDGAVWRAAYTRQDKIAKKMLNEWMIHKKLSVREDAVGNIFGRVEGNTPETLLIGSHLDTVINGGKYDGAAGIVLALAAVGDLTAEYGKPKKSLEVVAFAEEEGSRFGVAFLGSMAMMGKLSMEDLQQQDCDGVTIKQAMVSAGCYPHKLEEAKREDILSYVELHVEQGPVLDNSKIKIGIVENIVGCITYSITIKGEQNHAGTTPMPVRKDPVAAAAKFICEITSYAQEISSTATLTIGKIEAIPGMANVIAEKVQLSIDIRDGNKDKLIQINDFIQKSIREIKHKGYEVYHEKPIYEMPVSLDTGLIQILDEVSEEAGINTLHMNSGAGHDAQIIAPFIPSCMIFVPSKDGISHSPKEYTAAEDLEEGLRVLKGLIKKLAW